MSCVREGEKHSLTNMNMSCMGSYIRFKRKDQGGQLERMYPCLEFAFLQICSLYFVYIIFLDILFMMAIFIHLLVYYGQLTLITLWYFFGLREMVITFGGLLMLLKGDPSYVSQFELDQRLFCLIRKLWNSVICPYVSWTSQSNVPQNVGDLVFLYHTYSNISM
jgi:hypothetical protein